MKFVNWENLVGGILNKIVNIEIPVYLVASNKFSLF